MKKLLPFALAILLTGCASTETAKSDAVKQSEIYQDYNIEYDAGSEELSVDVTFRFGGDKGTTLELSGDSKILFNGEELRSGTRFFGGAYYYDSFKGELPQTLTFEYTNNDGEKYVNTNTIVPVFYAEYPGSVKKGESFSVSWSGGALGSDEDMYGTISDNNGHSYQCNTSATGATSISFPPNATAEMEAGKAKITLKRKVKKTPEQTTNIGGRIELSFETEKKQIEILP
ncbi:MAG: hypothetical protein KKA07_18510 [Bacteroidetes bacterium]|nr:hypothetical protein [Bacteroidota bacterium]MBU1721065.1 hypothetical protein [Bacteroidota bacterium]